MGNQLCSSCQNLENHSEISNEGIGGLRVREKGLKNEEIDYSESTFNIWDAGGMSTFQSQSTFTNMLASNQLLARIGTQPPSLTSPSNNHPSDRVIPGSGLLKQSTKKQQVPFAIAEESEFETIADDNNIRKCSLDEEVIGTKKVSSDRIIEHEDLKQTERMTQSNMNQHNNYYEPKKYEDDAVGGEEDRTKMKKAMQQQTNNNYNNKNYNYHEIKLVQQSHFSQQAQQKDQDQQQPHVEVSACPCNPMLDSDIRIVSDANVETQQNSGIQLTVQQYQQIPSKSGDSELRTPTTTVFPFISPMTTDKQFFIS